MTQTEFLSAHPEVARVIHAVSEWRKAGCCAGRLACDDVAPECKECVALGKLFDAWDGFAT